jgi:hypothetical protein
MIEKDPKSRLEHWALIRHSAVSWIEQSLSQGNTLGRALALASELDWDGRRYSPRTLEGWLYEWRAQGFGALERQSRRDKGVSRALSQFFLLSTSERSGLKCHASCSVICASAIQRQIGNSFICGIESLNDERVAAAGHYSE